MRLGPALVCATGVAAVIAVVGWALWTLAGWL